MRKLPSGDSWAAGPLLFCDAPWVASPAKQMEVELFVFSSA